MRENTHLINFDRDVVAPLGNNGQPVFNDLGVRAGSCTLTCHDSPHNDTRY